jgi:DNA integrity scanning protein DisA with diadenylate cyclase activity
MSADRLMLETGLRLAAALEARAVVAFVDAEEVTGPIPVIRAPDLSIGTRPASLERAHDVLIERLRTVSGPLALDMEKEVGVIVGIFSDGLITLSLETLRSGFDLGRFAAAAPREVISAALRLALEIGREGREGKPVGTAFIIGDGDQILAFSHQLILNPYLGHPPEVTTIMTRENWESVKEFAQLDGMFVIDRSGAVIAAGRYLDVDSKSVCLPSGLGGRHRAAAAMTQVLPVVAVIISESGGTVRVFYEGTCRIEIRPGLGTVHGCA